MASAYSDLICVCVEPQIQIWISLTSTYYLGQLVDTRKTNINLETHEK